VRRRPYSVVLFDEIEKAHPEVFNALLQILDDGRLTDGKGRTVDFTNCIVIMTSNLGSDKIRELARDDEEPTEEMGESAKSREERIKDQVMEELRYSFRPEFLNRLDDIIIFHALSRQQIVAIVDIQIRRLNKRLAEMKLELVLDKPAKEKLANEGFDPAFGARPLKRAIQNLIENPLAMEILAGHFRAGDVIEVGVDRDGMRFGTKR